MKNLQKAMVQLENEIKRLENGIISVRKLIVEKQNQLKELQRTKNETTEHQL